MKRKQIEKTATEYADRIPQSDERKEYSREDFIAGAQWRINSVWHDKKDPPKIGEEILMESVLLSGKTMYKVRVMTDYKEWQENNFIKSWAYIDDLLPNGKKATE